MDFLPFDFKEVITHAGLWAIFATIFSESGLLIGFFLPGDTLLFTAGLLASQGFFSIYYLIIGGIVAAILGDNLGYQIGRKYGHRVFNREESAFFHKDHVERARKFYEKYGAITIVLARFVPIVRTFAPVLAGVGHMNYPTFLIYNIFGGVLWITAMSLLGYFLGSLFPDLNIDRYIFPLIGFIVVGSIALPPAVKLIKRFIKPN